MQPVDPNDKATDIMRVISWGGVKYRRELVAKIDEWQVRVDAVNRDHGEELSETMKLAALVPMLPRDIRDIVCQSLDVLSTNRGMRDKVRNGQAGLT